MALESELRHVGDFSEDFLLTVVDGGADPDTVDADGQSALHQAVFHGYARLVRALADKGARLDAVDEDGRTPIASALLVGHTEIARFLASKGAPFVAGRGSDASKYALAAAYRALTVRKTPGAARKARSTEEKALDAKLKGALSRIPTREGCAAIVSLLEAGADPNTRSRSGEPVLNRLFAFASRGDRMPLLSRAIELGADVNGRSRDDEAPLLAAAGDDDEEAISLLLGKGAAIDAPGPGGRTALHHAAHFRNGKAVAALLLHGADAHLPDDAGKLPLDTARESLAGTSYPAYRTDLEGIIRALEGASSQPRRGG